MSTKKESAALKPGAFDLEAWVAGKVTPTETVEVSSKAGLASKLQVLVAQFAAAKKVEPKRTRLAEKEEPVDLDALEAQVRELAAELEGSWVEVEFRAPTPTERRESVANGAEGEEETNVAAMLQEVGRLRPKGDEDWVKLDRDGWLAIFKAIGNSQYMKISEPLAVLAYGKGVTPGFSQRALSYLETRSSSKS